MCRDLADQYSQDKEVIVETLAVRRPDHDLGEAAPVLAGDVVSEHGGHTV